MALLSISEGEFRLNFSILNGVITTVFGATIKSSDSTSSELSHSAHVNITDMLAFSRQIVSSISQISVSCNVLSQLQEIVKFGDVSEG